MKKIQLIVIFLILLASFPACDTTSDQTADVTETLHKDGVILKKWLWARPYIL
jgi:hypothetical protein